MNSLEASVHWSFTNPHHANGTLILSSDYHSHASLATCATSLIHSGSIHTILPTHLSNIPSLCVSMEQHCMNLRRSQLIGMLRQGQHWMLHWNSTLVITGPRTSSSSSVTVGHVIVVESISEYIHCGWRLTAAEWQICSRAVSVFCYSVFAVLRMDAGTVAWTVDCVWEVTRFVTAQMLKINNTDIDLEELCDCLFY